MTAMACIDYYVINNQCNAASSNYTFTDTGSVVRKCLHGRNKYATKVIQSDRR